MNDTPERDDLLAGALSALRIAATSDDTDVLVTSETAVVLVEALERAAATPAGTPGHQCWALDDLLQAHSLHEYDDGFHRFPSGGRPPCRGCLALALLGRTVQPLEYAAIADKVMRGLEPSSAAVPAGTPSDASRLADGVALIAAERRRQVEREGWSPEHDAEHISGELARAAATYAMPDYVRDLPIVRATLKSIVWPDGYNGQRWDFRPSSNDRVRELVKAGALVAAEIDRLLATPAPAPTEDTRD